MINKIMFVCHGNICRSPMAEFIFKDMLKKEGITGIDVSSSATSTEEIFCGIGNEVYPPAKAELKKHGISCEGKRAVQVKKSDYTNYDMFIVMDSNNYRNIMRIFGTDTDKKVYKMMSFADSEKDVADPWYTDNFSLTYDDIYIACKGLISFLNSKT